jgi:monofunctional glycosyltransferase
MAVTQVFHHVLRLCMRILSGAALTIVALTLLWSCLPLYSSVMLQSGVRGEGMARRAVSLRHVSPHLVNALIAAEDGRFCVHHGIDWKAAQSAYERNQRARRVTHGASTLTMQVAKNLFLWNGRSWIRKGLEIPLALWLDMALSKRRLIEIYLNTAEWGRGVFGVELAAQRAFGVSAARLSPMQSALLVAALPSPRKRTGAHPTPSQQALAGRIVARMNDADTSCVLKY